MPLDSAGEYSLYSSGSTPCHSRLCSVPRIAVKRELHARRPHAAPADLRLTLSLTRILREVGEAYAEVVEHLE